MRRRSQQGFQLLFQNFDSIDFLVLWLQVVVSNDQGLVLMRLQQPDEQGAQSAQFAAANQAVVIPDD